MVVDLEAVQVVCVSLEPHEKAAVRHESREPTASRVGGRVISLKPEVTKNAQLFVQILRLPWLTKQKLPDYQTKNKTKMFQMCV